jgi:hypothetical protein
VVLHWRSSSETTADPQSQKVIVKTTHGLKIAISDAAGNAGGILSAFPGCILSLSGKTITLDNGPEPASFFRVQPLAQVIHPPAAAILLSPDLAANRHHRLHQRVKVLAPRDR